MNNPHLTAEHLTDAQLYDLLDKPMHASGTHLHTCVTCQLEFSALRSSLDNFRIATTNLASAEMPPLAPQRSERAHPARFSFRLQVYTATFATAAVLLAASVTLIHPHHGTPATPVAVAAQPASTVSDAALLDGIQQDLSASVPPSLAPLEVASATSSIHHQN